MSEESKTEIAPYKIIKSAQNNIEIRTYEHMILVSAPMPSNSERNRAFMTLFRYISGDNIEQSEIEMTAPVLIDQENADQGRKIPMTAPVIMDDADSSEKPMMSFVMPKDFTLETTPKPVNDDLSIHEIKDYTVATIRFNGRLSDKNIKKHKDILEQWVIDNGYKIVGHYQTAGYDAPFTLPMFRRNEIFIPIEK